MNIYHFKRAVVSAGLILNRPPLVGANDGDGFGYSVDFNSTANICAVGAPWYESNNSGEVRVYKLNETTRLWEQFGNSIVGQPDEQIGYSVSISNNGLRVVVGNKGADDFTSFGFIYIYDYDVATSQWIKSATIGGEGTGYWSGFSVAINGDGSVIAFGSPKDDTTGEDRGSVLVFREDATAPGNWIPVGGVLYGEVERDNSGWSIALNAAGDILAVGAPFNDSSLEVETGHVRVFQYDGQSQWNQIGQDIDGTIDSQTGFSVDLNSAGDILAIGNIHDSTYSPSAGVVKIYRYSSSADTWNSYGNNIIIGNAGELTGYAVSLNSKGDTISVGSPYADSSSKTDVGKAQLYRLKNNVWEKYYPRISGIIDGEKFGLSTALSKNTQRVIVGAPEYTDKLGRKVGAARIYSIPKRYAFWTFSPKIATLNSFNVVLETSTDNITINWGDGSSDTVASATSVNHSYTI